MNINKIALIYNHNSKHLAIIEEIKKLYNYCKIEEAEVIIVIGGMENYYIIFTAICILIYLFTELI